MSNRNQLKKELSGYTNKIIQGKDISAKETQRCMDVILNLGAYDATSATFFGVLANKTNEDYKTHHVLGSAKSLQKGVKKVKTNLENIVDIFTAGAEDLRTVYVTPGAGIIASTYVPTVVQGCGPISGLLTGGWAESDILRNLGLETSLNPQQASRILNKANFVYLQEEQFHDIGYFIPFRGEMGIRDLIKASLVEISPVNSKRRIITTYSKPTVKSLAYVLKELGTEHSLVTTAECGCDEIAPIGKTFISEITKNNIKEWYYDSNRPITGKDKSIINGGKNPAEEAKYVREVLTGKRKDVLADIIYLNAGATIYLGGKAASINKGYGLAKDSVVKGFAKDKFEFIKETYENETQE